MIFDTGIEENLIRATMGGAKPKIYNQPTITKNGVYPVPAEYDGFGDIEVQVPKQGTLITPPTFTENNTYNASDYNADGFKSVTVNVPTGGGGGGVSGIISTEGFEAILGLTELGQWTDDNGWTVKAVYGDCCGAGIAFGANTVDNSKQLYCYISNFSVFDICIKNGNPIFAVYSGGIRKEDISFDFTKANSYEFSRLEVTNINATRIAYKRYYKVITESGVVGEKYQVNSHKFRRLIHTYSSTGSAIVLNGNIYTNASIDELKEAHEYLINHYTY